MGQLLEIVWMVVRVSASDIHADARSCSISSSTCECYLVFYTFNILAEIASLA